MDYKSIASSGGGFILDASRFTVMDLKSIASSASGKGYVTIKNLAHFTVMDLKSIASSGGGHVIFDFT